MIGPKPDHRCRNDLGSRTRVSWPVLSADDPSLITFYQGISFIARTVELETTP
jgi:hypothetical protein